MTLPVFRVDIVKTDYGPHLFIVIHALWIALAAVVGIAAWVFA